MKYLINIIFIFCYFTFLSQTERDFSFDFFNSSIKLYSIGESHDEKNSNVQLAIIDYIQENTKIDVLILEVPDEVGRIFNEYVLTGNKSDEVDIILSLIGRQASKNTNLLLKKIKEHNATVKDSLKVKIMGVDLFGFSGLHRQVKLLSILFPELSESDISLVNKILFNDKKKRYNINKSKIIIDNLINDININNAEYAKYLGDRLPKYKEILNQLKIEYMKDWRKYDSIRENFMTQNLKDIIDNHSVSVLICGAAHAMFKEKDTFYYGYPFTSMVAHVKKLFPNYVYTIILHYHKKKLFRFFSEFNLLSNELGVYFENTDIRYKIISDEKLNNHPEAKKRCDMVIVKNNK